MKILLVDLEETWRGGEKQTLLLMKGLINSGVNARLLCTDGYPLHKRALSIFPDRVDSVSNNISAFAFIIRYGKAYDIIHTHAGRSHDIVMLTKCLVGRPVVHTRRVDFVLKRKIFTRWKYMNTDRIVAVSGAVKRIIGETISRNDIEIVHDAVDTETESGSVDDSAGMRLKRDMRINGRIIATTAALVPHKDPFTLAEAMRLVFEKVNDVIFLHFGSGKLMGDMVRVLNSLGIQDRYKLMGFHENVMSYFAIFDVFVMSSKEEGLGSSVLDAFLHRVPVVATDAGGLPELVRGRGLICPSGSPQALADGILMMLDDPFLRRTVTENAYRYVKEYHSIERMTEKYVDIYKRVLNDAVS